MTPAISMSLREETTHRPVFHEVPAIRKLHRGDYLDDVTLLMVSSILDEGFHETDHMRWAGSA